MNQRKCQGQIDGHPQSARQSHHQETNGKVWSSQGVPEGTSSNAAVNGHPSQRLRKTKEYHHRKWAPRQCFIPTAAKVSPRTALVREVKRIKLHCLIDVVRLPSLQREAMVIDSDNLLPPLRPSTNVSMSPWQTSIPGAGTNGRPTSSARLSHRKTATPASA